MSEQSTTSSNNILTHEPTYNFISDFLELNSGTECHRNFLRWAAIAALGAASGPRFRLLNGTYYIYPLMYIIFVGPQGCRKNYAMSQAKDYLSEAFPDYPIGADITTRDDIIRLLASESTEFCYTDAEGISNIYHPLGLFISEFKDFTSYSPSNMINFLTNIYDYVDRVFHCSTIKRGAEDATHPFVPVLACENTDWFLKRLKEGVVTGGFSRRFNVIYEWQKPLHPVPRIIRSPRHDFLRKRLIAHLQHIRTRSCDYEWTTDGQQTFDKWYIKNFHTHYDDPTIAGFMASKDQQVLKLCILVDQASSHPTNKITRELVEEVLTWFEAIEPGLIRLYSSGGRNELKQEQDRIIDLINNRGGIMTEKEVLQITGKDLNPREQQDSLKYLIECDKLVKKAFFWPETSQVLKTWLVTVEGIRREDVQKAVKKFNNSGNNGAIT